MNLMEMRMMGTMRTSAFRKLSTRSTISTVSSKFIPMKTKEEIIMLNEEDSKRWNATTLAVRFGANHDSVSALLRLANLRSTRSKYISQQDDEKRKRLEELQEKCVDAWDQLMEVGGIKIPYKRSKPSSLDQNLSSNERSESVEVENADSNTESLEKVEEEKRVQLPLSEWAQWLEKEGNNAPVDVQRRTSFAFIEIGAQKRGERGAVWLREGLTGKLRIADEEERRLLLSEVSARDSDAFR